MGLLRNPTLSQGWVTKLWNSPRAVAWPMLVEWDPCLSSLVPSSLPWLLVDVWPTFLIARQPSWVHLSQPSLEVRNKGVGNAENGRVTGGTVG